MKYKINDEIFEKLSNACFGVVFVKNIDNTKTLDEIDKYLNDNILECEKYYEGVNIKEAREIVPYREAFLTLGINPNKYMCSIEALLSRIAKGKGFPLINSAVNLGNAISIKYKLPIGAHDYDTLIDSELVVRTSNDMDTFIPFGSTDTESVDIGEIVYASSNTVRTRRFTWRQSEIGKITKDTKSIVFPIDGFTDVNKDQIIFARDELVELLKKYFSEEVYFGFIDSDNREVNF